MSAPTLGPWKPEILPGRNSLIVSVVADNDDETMVCECYEGEDEERVAYARLIAAAPELLKALDYVIRDLELRSNLKRGDEKGEVDIGHGAYMQAKVALAKATGGAA